MDVRTWLTLILLSDLSGFHVEDLHSLTKGFLPCRFDSFLVVWSGQLWGRGPSGSCGGGCSAELGASAQSPGGVTGLERRAVVLSLQDSSRKVQALICYEERQKSSLFAQRWMGGTEAPDGV